MNNGRRYLILIGVGLLSGFASLSAVYFEDFIENYIPFAQTFVFLSPAILFGLVTGLYFMYISSNMKKIARLLGWIFGSSASFFAAIYLTGFIVGVLSTTNNAPITTLLFSSCLAVGGAVGALILCLTFHLTFSKLSWGSYITTAVVGAVIPFLVNYFTPIMDSYTSPSDVALSILFVVWQTAITVLLGRNLFVQESPVLATQ